MKWRVTCGATVVVEAKTEEEAIEKGEKEINKMGEEIMAWPELE